MQPQTINDNYFFNTAFNSWLAFAQKHHAAPIIAMIKEVALSSFLNRQKELNINEFSPDIKKTVDLPQVKNNYYAAFLVATCNLQKLIGKWCEQRTSSQREVLLKTLIACGKFSDQDFCQFMLAVGINNPASCDWFIYEGNQTEAYLLCVQNRGSTPQQIYDKYQGYLGAPNKERKNKKEEDTTRLKDLSCKTPATTQFDSVDASKPAQSVGTIHMDSSVKPLETIFLPIYFTKANESQNKLNILKFINSISKLEFPKIIEQMNEGICSAVGEGNFLVDKTYKECWDRISSHSWYKYYECALVLEMKVNQDAIGREMSEADFSGAVNAKSTKALNLINETNLEMSGQIFHTKNGIRFINISSTDIFTVSNPILTNDSGVYFYKEVDGCLQLLIVQSLEDQVVRHVVPLDRMDISDKPIVESLKSLHEMDFIEGVHNIQDIGGRRSCYVIERLYRILVEESFVLFNLFTRLQQAKLEGAGKRGPILTAALGFMKQHSKDKPFLLQRMQEMIIPELMQTDETNALLLLQGFNDLESVLSNLPKELIRELIQKGLQLEKQWLEESKEASFQSFSVNE